MKNILFSLFLITTFFSKSFSQIPQGYYDNAIGKTGEALKTALYNIIKGHTVYPYTSSETDTWDILKETDRDTLNPENVILVYTGWSVNAAQEYNNGNGWEREHCWPKSHGFPYEEQPAYTDIHHLKPIDGSVNSARNSRWYAECDEQYWDDGGTIPTDSWTSSTEWIWKPRDLDKGDCARMMFYMATRYEGAYNPVAGVTEPDLELLDYLQADDNSPLPYMSLLSDLLAWNGQDTVSAFERNRQEVIYGYQGNRNPFIDHPEYACMIFGSDCPGVEDPYAFIGEGVTSSQIDISWELNDYTNPVLVAWNTNNVFGTPSGTYTSGETIPDGGTVLYTGDDLSCQHTGVSQQTYYYKIWSLDPVKAYSPGVEMSATPLPSNAVYNPFERVLIFPNPSDGVFTVEARKGMDITITDVSGRMVFKHKMEHDSATINISNLIPGIYIMNLQSDDAKITKRFVLK